MHHDPLDADEDEDEDAGTRAADIEHSQLFTARWLPTQMLRWH